jgi:ornithine decarboxylase
MEEFCNTIIQRNDAKFEEVKKKIAKLTASGKHKDSFYLFDIENVTERIKIWRYLLPRVEIFYAVKTNTNPRIIQKCIDNNTCFDVASETEIKNTAAMGVKPENCIYASPIKKVSSLLAAKEQGIFKMTFDTIEELHKIAKYFPEAECVLRIATDTTTAIYNLSEKYGAPMEDVPSMLQTGKELGLRIKGVSFHTGSGGVEFESYESSLYNTRKIFDMAQQMGMEKMDLIDIGGGFTLVNKV